MNKYVYVYIMLYQNNNKIQEGSYKGLYTKQLHKIDDINKRIKREVCYKTLEELTDEKLMCVYKECNSVKNEIIKLSIVLEKYTDEETKQKIIQEYLMHLIPAGTKGVIR